MENTKSELKEEDIIKIYDLKGSLIDRSTDKNSDKKTNYYIN